MINLVFADPRLMKMWLEAAPARQAAIYRIQEHYGALADDELLLLLKMDDAGIMRYEWQILTGQVA